MSDPITPQVCPTCGEPYEDVTGRSFLCSGYPHGIGLAKAEQPDYAPFKELIKGIRTVLLVNNGRNWSTMVEDTAKYLDAIDVEVARLESEKALGDDSEGQGAWQV